MAVYTLTEEEEKKEILNQYRRLLKAAKPILREGDTKVIRKAFDVAVEQHKHMRRKSGEPYIFHPIEVAQICVREIGLGTTSIVAALLHDVVEDTDTTLEDIEKMFGRKVSKIIDGLTKISGAFEFGDSQQAENFKKIVFGLTDDVRVILIKLADRLHNMRTMDSMPRHKQLKISSETIYIYAPLAHRLGLYSIKSELEDLYLKYTDNTTYNEIERKINETEKERSTFIRSFIKPLQKELRSSYIEFKIKGRPKSIYSIWSKMKKQNVPFEEVYDLFAVRIIVNAPIEDEKALCWQVYSIVTDHYQPNPNRLRDWISTPKANGYESLHTTVMSATGKWVEVQIRTERMDDISEKGYAAHWKYKALGQGSLGENTLDSWINKVKDLMHQNESNALEFMDDFKNNLFSKEIFVFTPKGDLKVLPVGATVIDYAFEVHTQIGLHCNGAKINNKLMPAFTVLKNGDQVDVITSNNTIPKNDWVKNVVTSKAKKKLKEFLNEGRKVFVKKGEKEIIKRLEAIDVPLDSDCMATLLEHYKVEAKEELFYAAGRNLLDLREIKNFKNKDFVIPGERRRELLKRKRIGGKKAIEQVKDINKKELIIGEGLDGLEYTLAKCCNPIPGDDVFGFVTINEGIKIHRTKCPNSTGLMSNYGYRIVKARWMDMQSNPFLTGIKVSGTDRFGLIADVIEVLTKKLKLFIKTFKATSDEGIFEHLIMLHVKDIDHLNEVIERLYEVSDVISVDRYEPEN